MSEYPYKLRYGEVAKWVARLPLDDLKELVLAQRGTLQDFMYKLIEEKEHDEYHTQKDCPICQHRKHLVKGCYLCQREIRHV
jgi:hypothetical protein